MSLPRVSGKYAVVSTTNKHARPKMKATSWRDADDCVMNGAMKDPILDTPEATACAVTRVEVGKYSGVASHVEETPQRIAQRAE